MKITFRPVIKMAVAAAIAGVVVFATTLAPKANAPLETRVLPEASLPLCLKGAACSTRDFKRRCQFDFRERDDEARRARIIALRQPKRRAIFLSIFVQECRKKARGIPGLQDAEIESQQLTRAG